MSKSTIHHLPVEIETLIPVSERSMLINQILSEARAGEFHDFRSKKYTCEKIQLVNMLQATNDKRLIPIAQAVVDGDYDESPNEDEIVEIKQSWLDGGGTIENWNILFKK